MISLEDYFTCRGLFTNDKQREKGTMNLATGFIASKSTNVDKTFEVGRKIVNELYNFINIKTFAIERKDLAIQLSRPNITTSAANDANISCSQIDPQVYLQRVLIVLSD